jgi:hypothetical protein
MSEIHATANKGINIFIDRPILFVNTRSNSGEVTAAVIIPDRRMHAPINPEIPLEYPNGSYVGILNIVKPSEQKNIVPGLEQTR